MWDKNLIARQKNNVFLTTYLNFETGKLFGL